MNQQEQERFDRLYQQHLKTLKLQGKAQKTIDAYARAVRRISRHFDCCPDRLSPGNLQDYFADLVETHSWSTIKIDRNGLQHVWKFALKKKWEWIQIVKPPRFKTLPDILTPDEIQRIIAATRIFR
jgi:site-specific recombinase XerD